MRVKDLTGQRFGRLVAIEHIGFTKSRNAIWKMKCDCGNEKEVVSGNLNKGTQSCGCLFREQAGSYKKLEYGEAAKNTKYADYKRKAKNRNISFELTIDDFSKITQQDCHYCGIEPYRTVKTTNKTGEYIYNGIDRINSNEGYTINNVVACCRHCNQAKSNMTMEEFNQWIIRLFNHHINIDSAC